MRHHRIRLAAIAAALLLAGCGSGASTSSDQSWKNSTAYSEVAGPEAGYSGVQADHSADNVPLTAAVNRRQIFNAELVIEVQDVDTALQKVTETAEASGGFVMESQQSGTREDGRGLNVTLRVPWQQFRSVMTAVSSLGEVRSRREWTQDVTEQYVDLEARIATKETHLEQLRSLYSQSGTLTEMMALQEEIDKVTADLESMKGRMRVLSDQVSLSTITIQFFEAGTGEPQRPVAGVWERMTVGFMSSWRSVVRGLGDLAVAAAMLLPVLLFLGALVLVGYVIYLIARRMRKGSHKADLPTALPAAPPADKEPDEHNQ